MAFDAFWASLSYVALKDILQQLRQSESLTEEIMEGFGVRNGVADIDGWEFIPALFVGNGPAVLPVIGASALFASVSYLFYYKAIAKLGAAKSMALNITYTAWAIVLSVILLGDTGILNPLSIICTAVVVVCGILAACDLSALLGKKEYPCIRGYAPFMAVFPILQQKYVPFILSFFQILCYNPEGFSF